MTNNLQVHIQKDYDQSKDYDHLVEFTNGDPSGAGHQRAGEEV